MSPEERERKRRWKEPFDRMPVHPKAAKNQYCPRQENTALTCIWIRCKREGGDIVYAK